MCFRGGTSIEEATLQEEQLAGPNKKQKKAKDKAEVIELRSEDRRRQDVSPGHSHGCLQLPGGGIIGRQCFRFLGGQECSCGRCSARAKFHLNIFFNSEAVDKISAGLRLFLPSRIPELELHGTTSCRASSWSHAAEGGSDGCNPKAIEAEWTQPDRRIALTQKFFQTYPVPEEHQKKWDIPSEVDSAIARLSRQTALPAKEAAFKDPLDRRMESVLKRSYTQTAAILRPAAASAGLACTARHWAQEVVVTTNASLRGWGAVFKQHTLQGTWSTEESLLPLLELRAIALTLEGWSTPLLFRAVRVQSGNAMAVANVNKQGDTRSGSAMQGVTRILTWAEETVTDI
ncbi:uncharacterized protein LOC108702376 [Xenopus laevis]|uniref:Uncharacterized protein LOC108702376 n=1 Tax=Xenopus laevis TaxID=8355 RepID=A0A8J1LZX6_XENLA|nr:uncharacterized protein LOC108702376 [Xenopus laevis]